MNEVLIIKNITIEGPGALGVFLENHKIPFLIVDLSKGEKLPASPYEFKAVVILGGPMNVYEEQEYPFLKEENLFIQAAFESEIPMIGICLGAQLIAKAAGAKVYKARCKEIGWHKVKLVIGSSSYLFHGFPNNFSVFQWHGDTFDLPVGAELLATSIDCPQQAFRYGKCAYGLQFHLEVTAVMVKEWIDCYRVELEELDIDSQIVFQDTESLMNEYHRNANRLFSNFFSLID